MIELIGGKAGLSSGRFHYGSAFGEPSGNADKVERHKVHICLTNTSSVSNCFNFNTVFSFIPAIL